MEAVTERVLMRINEVCEAVCDKYSTDGELGDFCAQLLRHEKFVQWEILRETFLNFKEFEATLNRKRGNGCVNVEISKPSEDDNSCSALLKLVNIPRHGNQLTISLDVKQEGLSDDELMYTVYRLVKQLYSDKTDAAFFLWVTTSQQSSGDTVDTKVRHLAEKNANNRPAHQFMWDTILSGVFDLQFQLCPLGSRLSMTMWRISKDT